MKDGGGIQRHVRLPRRKAVAACVAAAFLSAHQHAALANPTGASVAAGSASFATQGAVLSVTNSPNAIINWQGFSIQAGETARFLQQSAASAVLNRVVGQDPSAILGTLQSNGRVFLINPSGILFGAGSRVDVGGLVASTLNISDQDFLAGKLKFEAGALAGSVVNQGGISTPVGGLVYLIAPDVQNSGVITSPRGDVILAAGKSVNLVEADVPDLRVQVDAGGSALNVGQIVADGGRAGIYAALIDQRGLVRADTVTRGENGQIVFSASQDITLGAGSVTSASGAAGGVNDGGSIRIVADGTLDMQRGSAVRVDGGQDGGNGGFLELSGRQKIALNGDYTGRAFASGYGNGTLLLDPLNINITRPGGDLLSGPVVLATDLPRSVLNIDPAELNGDWADVSLAATNNIEVNAAIANADLNNGTPGGSLTLTAGNTLNVNAPIGDAGARFDHDLTLTAGNDLNVNSDLWLGANALKLQADSNLNGTGSVNISPSPDSGPVTVSTLGDMYVSGVNFNVLGANRFSTAVDVGGRLVVGLDASDDNSRALTGSMRVQGGTSRAFTGRTIDTSATVKANAIKVNVGGDVTVAGGDSISAYTSEGGVASVTSNATLASATTLDIQAAGTVTVRGGDYGSASASWNGTATVDSSAAVTAGTTLNITAGSLTVRGGNRNSASASDSGNNTATVNANATLSGADLTIDVSGPVTIAGGSDASAETSYGSSEALTNNAATVNAKALVHATNNLALTVNGGDVTVAGGDYASASASEAYGVNRATANADAELSAGKDLSIKVTGGNLEVAGGNYASASASASSGRADALARTSARGTLAAGGNATIDVSGTLTVRGGDYASASASGTSGASRMLATLNADGSLSAGGTLSLSAGSLTVRGGNGGSAEASDYGQNTASVLSNALVSAGGALALDVTGAISVAGGNNARASASYGSSGGVNTAAVSANALVQAGGTTTIAAGSLAISAGGQPSLLLYESWYGSGTGIARATGMGTNSALTAASAAIVSVGDLSYSGGSVTLQGGIASSQADALGVNSAAAQASAELLGAGNKSFAIDGDLEIYGGTASVSGASTAVANAVLDPGTLNVSTTSNVTLAGGSSMVGGTAAQAYAAVMATGPINMTIGGSLNITGSFALPLLSAPSTPITLIFTGAGGQNFIVDSTLAPAYIQTSFFVPLEPLVPLVPLEPLAPLALSSETVVASQLPTDLGTLFSGAYVFAGGGAAEDGSGKEKPQSCN